jgi:hypothetical protein
MNVGAAYSARELGTAFRPLVRELARVTNELQLLLDTRQANAAAEALKIYALAKTPVSRKVHHSPGELGPEHLEVMKRDLGRRGRRKKKAGAAAVTPTRKKSRRPRKPRTIGQRLQRRVER